MGQYLIAFDQPDGSFSIMYGKAYGDAYGADREIARLIAQDEAAGATHEYIIIDMPVGWRYGPA